MCSSHIHTQLKETYGDAVLLTTFHRCSPSRDCCTCGFQGHHPGTKIYGYAAVDNDVRVSGIGRSSLLELCRVMMKGLSRHLHEKDTTSVRWARKRHIKDGVRVLLTRNFEWCDEAVGASSLGQTYPHFLLWELSEYSRVPLLFSEVGCTSYGMRSPQTEQL